MKKGEIWWAALPKPRGSKPGFRRPIVIVSANTFNANRINAVLAAVITSNLRLGDAPGNIKIKARESKLDKDSIINVSQIITIDKDYLTEKVAKLNSQYMNALNNGLALVLGL